MNPHDHTLADELHACVMELARIHHIVDQLIPILEAFGSPHHELEPSNVIIGSDDSVSLRHGSRAAREPWAAPETLRDGTLTYRSNVYSVGAILKAMFADRPELPDEARNLAEHCMMLNANGRPKSLDAVRSGVRALGWGALRRARGEWYRKAKATDDRERTFIDSLRKAPDDEAMRGVYADWLEQSGDAMRATFLRSKDPEDLTASPELASWRAIVSRATTIGCSRADCEPGWHALKPRNGIDNIRDCARCNKVVTYCTSLEHAENRGRQHAPIALDARLGFTKAASAHERGRMPPTVPMRTYNPPPPTYNPPPPTSETQPPPGNPPRPDYRSDEPPGDRNVLARFFGWFRRR
jgi:uncharacterized protein (TIGR02996 family)